MIYTARTVDELVLAAPLLLWPDIFDLRLHFTGNQDSLSSCSISQPLPLPSTAPDTFPDGGKGNAASTRTSVRSIGARSLSTISTRHRVTKNAVGSQSVLQHASVMVMVCHWIEHGLPYSSVLLHQVCQWSRSVKLRQKLGLYPDFMSLQDPGLRTSESAPRQVMKTSGKDIETGSSGGLGDLLRLSPMEHKYESLFVWTICFVWGWWLLVRCMFVFPPAASICNLLVVVQHNAATANHTTMQIKPVHRNPQEALLQVYQDSCVVGSSTDGSAHYLHEACVCVSVTGLVS